ncbi:MAG: 2,3-bisphosphoglycerate-independent phosphoglycerate mutase [Myxococcota bacterium]
MPVRPLAANPALPAPNGPVVLCIMDGVGLGDGGEDDAVATARTPRLDALMREFPTARLKAHGTAVGLPSDADMGNSEVGHNAMGCGRVFEQGAKLVDGAIASGALWEQPLWRELCAAHTLHLVGLVSDGNVHCNVAHLDALTARAAVEAAAAGARPDRRPRRALPAARCSSWSRSKGTLAQYREAGRDYRVASGGGRMRITMDRYEADWPMVARGWATHVRAEAGGPRRARRSGIPAHRGSRLTTSGSAVRGRRRPGELSPIRDGDAVLPFNFWGDRAIELSRAFDDGDDFSAFDRGLRPDVLFAGMMEYDGDLHVPKRFLVPPPAIDRTVGEFLVASGKRTFACSETQKFGHVTYFFNGNRSGRLDEALETYVEVPSDTLPFQQRPWMKAAEITDAVVQAIRSGDYDHVRLNFANGDMVGHTGDLEATRVAVEAVDLQIGRLWAAVKAVGGVLLVTADHGNADQMWQHDKRGAVQRDEDGRPIARTSHSLAPVPLVVADPARRVRLREGADGTSIAAIGATVLALCGLQPPDDYLPALVEM